MKKYSLFAAMVLLGILILFSASTPEVAKQGQVTGLTAMDAPFDDGSGIVLKWKPLSKEHRIIQYKIYRGCTPDTLFFHSSMDVDPSMGVIGDELSFTDSDYQPLFEFETAPAKLKKEKHQGADSPLYRAVPRDPEVIGSLVDRYDMLGAINHSAFYHKSQQVKLDQDTFAGYKLNQFDLILANPKAGNEYYYTVLAVNERGRHLPAAEIVSAIPVDNRPAADAVVNATYVEDTQELGFEWDMPEMGYDIALYTGWLLPKDAVPLFKAEQELNLTAEDEQFHAAWQERAIKVFDSYVTSGSKTLYEKVDLKELGISLSRAASDYLPVLSYMDYSQYQNASIADTLYIKHSSQYPDLPAFSVHDKQNDKGDSNHLSMGKPIVYITQASYTSSRHDKLKFNYEILENYLYPIERLRFTFKEDSGKKIGEVTEYYPDKLITMKLPKDFEHGKSFKVETRVMLRKNKGKYEEPAAHQDIVYEEATLRYLGKHLSIAGKRLDRVYLDVFTKNKLSPYFNPGMRSNGMIRALDHTINYPDVLYKPISDYDAKSQRMLISPVITVAFDEEKMLSFGANIYRDVFEQELKEMRAEADSLGKIVKGMQAAGDTLSEAYLMSQTQATEAEDNYSFIINHPTYKQAQQARSEKAWRKILLNEMNRNSRTYAYQLLLTDGHGFIQRTDTYKDAEGNEWFFPVPQWFDMSKLATLLGTITFGIMIVVALVQARRRDLYIRPIAGLEELDNAVGRATEMGRPVMFVPGWGSLGDPCTISALMILGQTAKKTAEFDVRLISPHCDYFVMPLAQEMVQSAYNEAGRPDSYNAEDIFYVSDSQFAFAAGVNGIIIRERAATVLYMGYFNAEALLMTETGNQMGCIQIAGTDAITQVPFFITTCDYTLIGEEFYAASAYLSRNIELVSMLKAQDYFKVVMIFLIIVGTFLSSVHWHGLLHFLPFE